MGTYPEAPKPPFVPGYEVAGTVIEVGSSVKNFQKGDRVLAGTRFGGYTTEVVVPEFQVKKIPGKLTDTEAAAIPVNFMTAWVALQDLARIRKGDRVLIQSAAGGVGVAAVQIAAQMGAHVVGTVSSKIKADIFTYSYLYPI
jgi:NADPH:quinone reductase-like Zn-dependent oxidoreductase